MGIGRILQNPAGPSERIWNNQYMSSDKNVLCEICGTFAPENEDSIIDSFLELQLVENCCGKLIDHLFEEFGMQFCLAFLEKFAKNPTDPSFATFKISIASNEELKKLKAKAEKIVQIVKAIEQITTDESFK